MQPASAGSLLEYLQQIPDPRGRKGRRHNFEAMLATIVCAFLQGARGFSAIAQWIHSQDVHFWHALGYTRRPPKLGAFRKLLMKLSAECFERAIGAWVTDCLDQPADGEALQPLAMDGKTLCGTLQPHQRALHLLSVLDQATGCTLNQVAVDDDTNEFKTVTPLLRELVLKGRVVTGDAMFCQREVCQHVVSQGGHYLLIVKDNHWGIENRSHNVRDVTLSEDACRIRKGHAPQNFAALRNAAVAFLRLQGHTNLAAAFRACAWKTQRLLAMLGIFKK